MSVASMAALGARVDREVGMVVADMIGQYGVPRTLDESMRLAELLHPQIVRLRRGLYRSAALDMGQQVAELGLSVRPARLAPYDVTATYKLINRAVGLGDVDNTVAVQFLSEETRRTVTRRVAPYLVDDPDESVIKAVTDRIGAASARHAREAARSLIVDTARRGDVFDTKGKSRKEVGYARVLTGKENCWFCSMLASRGAVYSSDTVLRQQDGQRYHDNCDCEARLVVRGYRWEGDEEAMRLYHDEWLPATKNFSGGLKRKQWKKRWAKLDAADFTPINQRQG